MKLGSKNLLLLGTMVAAGLFTTPTLAQNPKKANFSMNQAKPSLVIYKTRKDYKNLVPITLSDDKKTIVSYPDPKDIFEQAEPEVLKNGYLIDNIGGINPNTAFLKISYAKYKKLKKAPTMCQLKRWIKDKNPIVELYNCGPRTNYQQPVEMINKIIESGEMDRKFEKIK